MFSKSFESQICTWLEIIVSNAQPSDEIQVLNFWIYQNSSGYNIYLIWSKSFDWENDDWACNQDFVPIHNHITIKGYFINTLSWDKFLEKAYQTLEKLLKTKQFRKSFFEEIDYICIWFDDGDLQRIK